MGRFLLGAAQKGIPDFSYRFLELNGGPAPAGPVRRQADSVFQLDVADGRIQSVYIIRNPDKLRFLDTP